LSTSNLLNKRRLPKTIMIFLRLFVMVAPVFFASPVRGETVVATIPLGTGPASPIASGIDVDALSNLIFVADSANNVVVEIDGYTNTVVATSPTLDYYGPYGLAVNPQTNKIFVTDTDIYGHSTGLVSVLDEATLSRIATVGLAGNPTQVAVNPVTDRVYVEEFTGTAVDVIDGSTYSVLARVSVSCAAGTDPSRCNSAGITVNPVTNKIYASFTTPTCCPSSGYTSVFAIDGSTNAVTANVTYADWLLASNRIPFGLATNSETNMLYAVSGPDISLYVQNSDSLHVIDASTMSIVTSIPLGQNNSTMGVGVDEATNRIYAGHGTVFVIDGTTNTEATNVPNIATIGVAVNPATSLIYVSGLGNSVTAVAGPSLSTHTTRTIVACDPGSAAVNQAAQCAATVTDTTSSPTAPTGTVSFTSNSSGTFSPSSTCILNPASSSASSCNVNYSPNVGSEGGHRITGTYGADSTHFASRGSFSLAVTKRSTSTSVSCTGHSSRFTCTASVSDTSPGMPLTPTGTVSWTSSSTSRKSGFSPPSCTLSGTGPTASCTVSYTNPGKSTTVTIAATYSGDASHFGSTGSTTLTT